MSTFKVDVLQSRSGGATTFTNQWAAKAWVNFDGTAATITPAASGNVGSITDNGVGDYTVNITSALADGNYSWTTNSSGAATYSYGLYLTPNNAPTNTALRLLARNNAGTSADMLSVNVSIIR